MHFLKASTAVYVNMGPFLDSTDGVTEETGLGNITVEVSKAGAAFGARNSGTANAHDAEGYYRVHLDTTDTGTVGPLRIKAHESGALPVWEDFVVLHGDTYDAFVTNGLNDVSTAEVNAQCDTALTDYDPPTKAELDSGLAALNDVSSADVTTACTSSLNTYDPPTRAELTSDISGLNDPTAAAVADAVWDEAKSGHTGAGSFGEEVQAHSLSSEIAALNDVSTAEVNAQCDTAISDAALATASALSTVDTVVDAIKAKTDNLPASPAAVGSEMTLATDAVDAGALKTDAVTEIVSAIFAKTGLTAGGSASFNDIVKALYSMARGQISRTGDNYAYKDDDDSTTLYTLTIASSTRTTA